MDHGNLRAAVTAYFREQLQRAKERRDKLGPFSPEERAQTEQGVKLLEEGNSEYWHLLGRENAKKDLDDFFQGSGLPRHEYAAHTPQVLNEIRLGRLGAHRAILEYVTGLEAYDFSEAQSGMQVALPPPAGLDDSGNEEGAQRPLNAPAGPLLSEMFAARQAEADRSKEWGPKLRADYSVWVGLFLELIGDRPIDGYRKADARAFKEVLQELPANRTKYVETQGLGMREAVQAGKKHGLAVISTSTVNKSLGRLQAIWKWADKQLDTDLSDIFGPMKVAARANARDEADPFSKDQLQRIFSGPVFTGCRSERFRAQAGDTDMSGTSWFWLPLLGLLTGARLNELCQLHLEDIDEEDGVAFLRLREGQEGQRIKSGTGRLVPLHPELIDVGILRYAEAQRRSGAKRLFPSLNVGSTGYYSDRPSKDFTAYLRGINAKTDKTSFHSFRHGFKDACRSGGVQPDIADILQGHSLHGMAGRYGDGKAPLSVLHEAVCKVSYPGLPLEGVRRHP
ncbi:site-specific integrase [Jannaschia sp.]|nr:site-specific integrase [Jannaschia sp.]